jgi:acyl dehydratase
MHRRGERDLARDGAVKAGERLPRFEMRVTRADLVRYAGASNDFNPIHWSERHAAAAGLPTTIAHGMLTMGIAVRAVTDWCGDPGRIADYGVRFSRILPVPDDDEGALLVVDGVVERIEEDGAARIALTVTGGGEEVLTRAFALVRA